MLQRTGAGLRDVFRTAHPVCVLTCSGTGAMESVFVSLFSPGETIVTVNAGKFGERWVTMPRALGLEVVELSIPWGDAPDPEALGAALDTTPDARAVVLTYCETSTGTMLDLPALTRAIRERSGALVCVDGVSAIGGLEFRMDEWGVDAAVSASQKGFMVPPGLGFVALGPRAQDAVSRARTPRFYLDLGRALRALDSGDTPWTPASTLIAALEESLALLRAEGMEAVWARHRRLAVATRAGVRGLGLPLLSSYPSDTVTAALLPAGVSWQELNRLLQADGIVVAGGQGAYAGKLVRISNLGFVSPDDIRAALVSLERALTACGVPVQPGAALAAFDGTPGSPSIHSGGPDR
jgi:serine---pyruvate transaminase